MACAIRSQIFCIAKIKNEIFQVHVLKYKFMLPVGEIKIKYRTERLFGVGIRYFSRANIDVGILVSIFKISDIGYRFGIFGIPTHMGRYTENTEPIRP